MNAGTEANGPTTGAVPVLATKPDDSPEACAEKARTAINAVVDTMPDRSDDESMIAYCYRKRETINRHTRHKVPDDEFNEWASQSDEIEAAIGRLPAESIRDVEIKLEVVCHRLREIGPDSPYETATLMTAQCALEDLRRLAGDASIDDARTIYAPAAAGDEHLLDLERQRREGMAQRRKLAPKRRRSRG